MRILCVLLPHFPVRCEIFRNPAIKECPAVITYGAGSQKLVLDYSPELEGLQRDMPLQQALARYDRVELVPSDMPYYRSAFNEILDKLEEISPLVEGSGLGTAYLGIDGLQLIYPDDDCLIRSVTEALPGVFAVQMGIAVGKFPAYLAALCSSPGGYRILAGDISTFLENLSCDVLPVSIKNKSKLRAFGINTLGQLSAFPAGPLQSQFGPEGRRILELSRGNDDTPLYPRMAEKVIEENTVLPSLTVSVEALLFAVETLLARVFAGISFKGLGIHSLSLWTRSLGSEHWERNIKFKEPAMDTGTAALRVKRVLENFPQPGPVEQVGIRVTRLGYPRRRQNSLFSEVRGRDHLLEDIRQLELRQGNPQVFKVKEVEPWSRIPERRYALTPAGR